MTDWRVLVIDETYVSERFEKIAMRKRHDFKIDLRREDQSLVVLISKDDSLTVSLRKKLATFYEDDEHWKDKRL